MPHLHTEAGQHDHTASAYVVRTDTPEPSLVLHMHKKLKQYLQFGGHIELHENPWDAVVHELAEESGYDVNQLKVLQPKLRVKKLSGVQLHPVPVSLLTHKFEGLDHYHTDIAFAFVAYGPPLNAVSEGESEKIDLFTAAELRALAGSEIPESVREIGLFILEEALNNWPPVNAWELG